jgi:hypothetical protein
MVGLLTGPVPAVAAGTSRGENPEADTLVVIRSRRPGRGTNQRGGNLIGPGGELRSLWRNGPEISCQR